MALQPVGPPPATEPTKEGQTSGSAQRLMLFGLDLRKSELLAQSSWPNQRIISSSLMAASHLGRNIGAKLSKGSPWNRPKRKSRKQLKETLTQPEVQVTLALRLTKWHKAEYTRMPFTISPSTF